MMIVRRITVPIVTCLAALAWPGLALAQEISTDIQMQQLESEPGAADILGVQSSEINGRFDWQVGLSANVADDVLEVRDDSGDTVGRIINSQTALDIMGSVGLWKFLELGLVIPVTAYRTHGTDALMTGALDDLSSAGLGDIRLVPKLRIPTPGERLGVAVSLPLSLPTGTGGGFYSDERLGIEPRVIADYTTAGDVRIAANLGVRLRSEQTFANLNVSNEFTYGVGVRAPLPSSPIAVIGTLVGSVGFSESDSEESPLELLAGVQYLGFKDMVVGLSAGPGLSNGYGTPDFRIVAGVTYKRRRPAPEPLACNFGPEDMDGFQDDDECADPDNDQDQIADDADVCPNEAETVNSIQDDDGCPEDPELLKAAQDSPVPALTPADDPDGDGIFGDDDRCPDKAEDVDQFEDTDGCPDLDNDRDAIADAADKCPLEAEVINGVDDKDGCPDEGKTLVQVTDQNILILDKVYFETAKATIKQRSFNVLNQVAATIVANPQLTKLRVEGHTDNRGKDDYNMTLSNNRANAVRDYMIQRGVQADRLVAQGYGETRPIATNKTKAGRAKNRRVEFVILEVNNKPVEPPSDKPAN